MLRPWSPLTEEEASTGPRSTVGRTCARRGVSDCCRLARRARPHRSTSGAQRMLAAVVEAARPRARDLRGRPEPPGGGGTELARRPARERTPRLSLRPSTTRSTRPRCSRSIAASRRTIDPDPALQHSPVHEGRGRALDGRGAGARARQGIKVPAATSVLRARVRRDAHPQLSRLHRSDTMLLASLAVGGAGTICGAVNVAAGGSFASTTRCSAATGARRAGTRTSWSTWSCAFVAGCSRRRSRPRSSCRASAPRGSPGRSRLWTPGRRRRWPSGLPSGASWPRRPDPSSPESSAIAPRHAGHAPDSPRRVKRGRCDQRHVQLVGAELHVQRARGRPGRQRIIHLEIRRVQALAQDMPAEVYRRWNDICVIAPRRVAAAAWSFLSTFLTVSASRTAEISALAALVRQPEWAGPSHSHRWSPGRCRSGSPPQTGSWPRSSGPTPS